MLEVDAPSSVPAPTMLRLGDGGCVHQAGLPVAGISGPTSDHSRCRKFRPNFRPNLRLLSVIFRENMELVAELSDIQELAELPAANRNFRCARYGSDLS